MHAFQFEPGIACLNVHVSMRSCLCEACLQGRWAACVDAKSVPMPASRKLQMVAQSSSMTSALL